MWVALGGFIMQQLKNGLVTLLAVLVVIAVLMTALNDHTIVQNLEGGLSSLEHLLMQALKPIILVAIIVWLWRWIKK